MPPCIDTSSQHAPSTVDTAVDNEKVIIPGEAVLVDKMSPSLLPLGTLLLAAFNKASINLFLFITEGSDQGVVILGNVKVQEMCRWKIPLAFETAISMFFLVVSLIIADRGERQNFVRR